MTFNFLNLKNKITNSISNQITFNFILLITVTIIIISFFIQTFVKQSLYTADKLYLNDEVNLIQQLLNDSNGNIAKTNGEIIEVPTALKNASYRYYVRIIDSNNNVVTETPYANDILNNAIFPKFKSDWENNLSSWYHNNRYYFLITAPLQISKLKKGIIYIALDRTYQQSLLNHLYWKLALISLMIILIISAISIFITRKKMNPLTKLANTAASIQINSLNQIIAHNSWPNELQPVAKAFNEMIRNIEGGFLKFKRSIAEMAHELKSPITNLISENSVTLSKNRSIEDYQNTIGSNLEELNRVNHIVNDILFIAQSDAQKTLLKMEVFSAYEIIQSIIDIFSALANEKNISIQLSGDAKLNMDLNLFKRVINNILSNAIAYSHSNSKILIHIKSLDKHAEIIFQDFGIGISETDLANIFEHFYRADNAREVNPQGNGLGLAIVSSIMKIHSAKINIISKLNEGTIVTLSKLPKK